MNNFLTSNEITKIRSASKDISSQIYPMWNAIKNRTYRYTSEDSLIQTGDTQEWWHLVWERMSDAAFVYAIEPDIKLGEWIRCRTIEICGKSIDEWVGPWFRKREQVLVGMLETAHVTNAVACAYDLCPELFSESEMGIIADSLKTKGQILCRRYIEGSVRNNWYCVILNGYITACAVLNDAEGMEFAPERYNKCCELYDSDGYGETLQYGNYASLSLSHAYEVMTRFDSKYKDIISLRCIANTVKWAISSFMYMRPDSYPCSLNFGDSAAVFRPTADVLLQIAMYLKNDMPTEAGLARWLFEQTYSNPEFGSSELATFGFFNNFQFYSLRYLLDSAEPISPKDAGMPIVNIFETGSTIIRDSWTDTKTILGIQGGYEAHKVDSHRHADQNSFILSHLNEIFFADPGHCCYRLETWRNSCKTDHHNTWDFYSESNERFTQTLVEGSIEKTFEPLNHHVKYTHINDERVNVIACDAAKAYGDHFKRAERVWITAFSNMLFIIDRIESDIPVKMCSHFIINNRNNQLNVNIADDKRLVFRRSPAAMKFFTFADTMTLSRRWGYIHDHYHPLPNHAGQGKEGSSVIFDYTSSGYESNHLVIHAVAMSHIDEIKKWHIKSTEDNGFMILPPNDIGGIKLKIDMNNDDKWFDIIY